MHLRTARRSAATEDMENGEDRRFCNLFGDSHLPHKSHRPVIKAWVRTRLKDVSGSLVASKQLIKVLIRMWSHEEQSSSGLTLISALKAEIDRAKHEVDQLMSEKREVCEEIDALLVQFAYEKAAWRREEHDRILKAVASLAREAAVEKKMRRQAERLNRRLGRELADVRSELKEIEGEKDGKGMEKIRREIEDFLGGKEGKSCSGDGEVEEDGEDDDEVFKGRRSICGKIQWESICLRNKG